MNNSRLQSLLRRNAGKRYMAEYLTELSKLITNNKFKILNLEESDIISKSIMDHHEKLLFKKDYWECRNTLFTQKEILKGIITKIQLAYSAPVYMSIGYSDMCGLVMIERISLFKKSSRLFPLSYLFQKNQYKCDIVPSLPTGLRGVEPVEHAPV